MDGVVGAAFAAVAALAAAGSFGVSAVLQHRQAHAAAGSRADGTRGLRLLGYLARRPLWLAGILLAAGAYGLQGLALAYGPLALVAPIVATDLLFAVPLAAWWSRRPMRPRDLTGCALVAAGVGTFLATSPPAAGRSDAPARDWLLAFGAVTLVCVAAVAVGHAGSDAVRAGALAVAAGLTFGLTAAVTLSATRLLRDAGPAAVLGHWQPWVLIVLGLSGLLLSQSAFQAGQLTASLPIIDTLEPISAVVLGAAIFHERLASSPLMLAVQLSGAAIAVAGVALLRPFLAEAEHSPGAGRPAGRAAATEARPRAGAGVRPG